MNELECPKCNNIYEAERIPKILPCGHTLCMLCAQDIICIKYCSLLSNNQMCKKSLTISSTSELPTNNAVLNLCSSLSNLNNFHKSANDLFEKTIKKSLLEIESSLDNILDKMNDFEKYDANTPRWNPVKTFEKLNMIKEKMETLFPENKYIDILKYKYTETDDALVYLIEKLTKGDEIFAAGIVQNQRKFGKVSLKGDGILVNSLSLTEVGKNSTIFWLNKFKKHFHKNLCSFLVLPCENLSINDQSYTMVFDIPKDNLRSGFVEICTGEMGSSFKGSSLSLRTPDFLLMEEECCNDMKVNCEAKYLKICDHNNIIISYISRGKWKIQSVKAINYDHFNVVGRLIDDFSFPAIFPQNSDKRFVKESGIAVFQIPQNTFRTSPY